MRLRFPAVCACGAACGVGVEVRAAVRDSRSPVGRPGAFAVVSCPACSENLSRGSVDAGIGMKAPGSNLAKRIERRRDKELRRRAREDQE